MPIPNRAKAQPIAFDWEEPLRAECRHFLDCIQTRSTPRTDGKEALRVLTVLQACQQRLERGSNGGPPKPTPQAMPYFAHESAFIDEGVETCLCVSARSQVGEGSTIWHVSHVLKNSRVGKNCRIGQNVVIGPNVTIRDGIKIQNNVSVYEGVTLGLSACLPAGTT